MFEGWFESVVCVFGGIVNIVVLNTNDVGILLQLPILITALEDPFEIQWALSSLWSARESSKLFALDALMAVNGTKAL